MLRSLFVFVVTLTLGFSPLAASEVDVYLLSGQSNMQGSGKVAEIPQEIPREVPNAYFFNGKAFEPLVLGKTQTAGGGNFGPEVGFALEAATAERPVYLIKYAASGMPLHHGWNGSKWEGGKPEKPRVNFYAGENAEDAGQGTLYRAMLARFRAGVETLEKEGHTPVIRGFAWMQGEADAKNEESATTYAASLKQLIRRLGEDMNVDGPLAAAYGQVLPHEPANARFTHRTETREQMAKADGASGAPEAIERAVMVSTDGFGMSGDTVHYNTAGQLQLGRALAKALKGLESEKKQ